MIDPIQPKSVSRKTFADSQEATFRRKLREQVRNSYLTSAEKAVTTSFLNHWFVHRHKGAVYPGRKRLAKRTGFHVNSVKAVLSLLREFGVIEAVAHLAGQNGKATEYTVNVERLITLCGVPKLVLKRWRSVKRGPKMSGSGGDKKCPPSNDCANVIPFRIQGENK